MNATKGRKHENDALASSLATDGSSAKSNGDALVSASSSFHRNAVRTAQNNGLLDILMNPDKCQVHIHRYYGQLSLVWEKLKGKFIFRPCRVIGVSSVPQFDAVADGTVERVRDGYSSAILGSSAGNHSSAVVHGGSVGALLGPVPDALESRSTIIAAGLFEISLFLKGFLAFFPSVDRKSNFSPNSIDTLSSIIINTYSLKLDFKEYLIS